MISEQKQLPSIFLLFLGLLLLVTVPGGEAKVACTSSEFCVTNLREGSKCVDGFCDNPYQYGCLQSRRQGFMKKRICNSEDPPDAANQGLCRAPPTGLEYPEIRIMSQNWESAFFEAWTLQIMLGEILDVPVTIETGVADKNVNFYDPQSRFEYGVGYDMEGLVRASQVGGDCRKVQQTEGEPYKGCGHAILEVWSGYEDRIQELVDEEAIEPVSFIGVIGEEGWLIPKFTAEADSTLLSYFGLSGEHNRQKLAERFLRPATWNEFCAENPDGCSSGIGPAARAPESEEEGQHYFVQGVYTGHFRATEANNCTKWPMNCTGHFLDYPCGWSSFFLPQSHHLEIALQSDGDELSGGYAYTPMVEIWLAANWTKSDIMGWWWRPEALYQQFQGTDFELQNVNLPPTNSKCIDSRINVNDRCGNDDLLRFGEPEGSCGVPPFPTIKLVSTGLYDLVYDSKIPEGRRSPAYDVVKLLSVNGFELEEMFEYWTTRNFDKYGYDPRDAVCRWISENYDELHERLVPRSYPRELEGKEDKMFSIIALSFGAFAVLTTLTTGVLTYLCRNRKVFKYAQVDFVFMLLFGLLLVSVAAVITVVPPTNATCVATIWLVNVGYAFELVPLVVKIAAINKMMNAAKKMQRIKLSRGLLFGAVAALTGIVVLYLIVWTAVDPPAKQGVYELTGKITEDGKTVVSGSYFCRSDSNIWTLLSVGMQAFFLLCASIVAFQTRRTAKDLNEASTVSLLIYWNFVCVLLRVILILLGDSINASTINLSSSLILSSDALATVVIYFVPKFLKKEEMALRTQISGMTTTVRRISIKDLMAPVPNPSLQSTAEVPYTTNVGSSAIHPVSVVDENSANNKSGLNDLSKKSDIDLTNGSDVELSADFDPTSGAENEIESSAHASSSSAIDYTGKVFALVDAKRPSQEGVASLVMRDDGLDAFQQGENE